MSCNRTAANTFAIQSFSSATTGNSQNVAGAVFGPQAVAERVVAPSAISVSQVFAPEVAVGPVDETPIPGGATAAGSGPTAAVPVALGAADASMARPFRDRALASAPLRYWNQQQISGGLEVDQVGGHVAAYGSSATTTTLIRDAGDLAVTLNGTTNSFADISSAAAYTSSSSRAYAVWISRDATDSGSAIFGGNTTTAPRLAFVLTTDAVFWEPQIGGAAVAWGSTRLRGGSGPHLVVLNVVAGTSAELFVDGVSLGSQSNATNFHASPGRFQVGATNSPAAQFFKGVVDEPLIWTRNLSPAEVLDLYRAGTGMPASATVSQGGATAGGVAPAEPSAPVSETPVPGGALAGGNSPAARVSVAAGGALGGGVAPSATATATPTPGGATAGGSGPTARVPAPQGGALGGGVSPSATISATPVPGAAVTAGNAPAARVSVPQGGALAGGTAPAAGQAAAVSRGGALGAGTGPTVRVALASGGAQAGGVAPTEGIAGGDVVPQGGATAQGRAPAPRVALTAGGATGSGQGPTARVTVAQGGALAAGVGATARVTIVIGGALAGGVAPTENVAGGDIVPAGGALAGGRAPVARASLTAGGALGVGVGPTARVTGIIAGALAGGRGPTVRVALAARGAIAGGVTIFIAEPYPETVLDDEPTLYWRLGEYV